MLKKIAKRIEKEIAQAEDYCHQAFIIKHNYSTTAELFVQLASEELVHAKKLLREGQKLIDDKALMPHDNNTKETDDVYYEKCKHIWEWEYRIAMERVSELEYKLNMYRSI